MPRGLFALILSAWCALSLASARFVARPLATAGAQNEQRQAFVTFSHEADLDSLQRLGVVVHSRFGHLATVTLPPRYGGKAAMPRFVQVIPARRLTLHNDSALFLSQVAPVLAGQGLPQPFRGQGVMIGIVDSGFDFNHINFKDSAGQCRITHVYMPADTTGPAALLQGDTLPGSSYDTPLDIQALTTDTPGESHGTHTLGTAAGSCFANPYHGVAPEAELVVCAMPEEQLTDVNIANSLNYIFECARQAGKPVVVNMSLGSMEGAHDGSSPLCQLMDSLSGPGRIIVLSAGNLGEIPCYLSHGFTSADDTLSTLLANWNGSHVQGYVSAWSSGSVPFTVSLSAVNRQTGASLFRTQPLTLSPDSTYELADSLDAHFGQLFHGNVKLFSQLGPRGRYHFVADVDAQPVNPLYRLALHLTAMPGDTVQLWGEGVYMPAYSLPGFTAGNREMTISDLATGDQAISVGSYDSRATTPGVGELNFFARSHPRGVSYFSGYGPDARGIQRPDVVAPGFAVVSSASRFDTVTSIATSRLALHQQAGGASYPYGAEYGTSMSAPVVAGAVALWLQARPELTSADVRRVLRNTSVVDGDLSATDSRRWGCGKLNVAAGIDYLLHSGIGRVNAAGNLLRVWPNPCRDSFTLALPQGQGGELCLFNLAGREVARLPVASGSACTLRLPQGLPAGVYVGVLKSRSASQSFRLIVQN